MIGWLRRGGPLRRDVLVAATALVAAFLTIGLAVAGGWEPPETSGYVFIAVLACAAWPLSRLAPRSTLVIVSVLVVVPPLWQLLSFVAPSGMAESEVPASISAWMAALSGWMSLEVPGEIRVVPVIVAAFRAATLGASAAVVVPVTAVVGLIAANHSSVWVLAGILLRSGSWASLPEGFVVGDASRTILTVAVMLVIVALGLAIRAQRRVAEELDERNAELLALHAIERERATAEVRTAIARDIHDIVAHHVTAMVIRAQAAERQASADPDQLRTTMRGIAEEGSDALSAMRRAVRMLRSGAADIGSGTHVSFDTAMSEMIDRVRAGGRTVRVIGALAPDTAEFVCTALLRIIQEALTNVMLHSTATEVTIAFDESSHEVDLTISDDGDAIPTAAPGSGNGITGMTERAHAVGGSLTAGPGSTGGWSVRALLPRTGRREHR